MVQDKEDVRLEGSYVSILSACSVIPLGNSNYTIYLVCVILQVGIFSALSKQGTICCLNE